MFPFNKFFFCGLEWGNKCNWDSPDPRPHRVILVQQKHAMPVPAL